jgi:hypothetical protein
MTVGEDEPITRRSFTRFKALPDARLQARHNSPKRPFYAHRQPV